MKCLWLYSLAAAAGICWSGCNHSPETPSAPSADAGQPSGDPQPKLKTIKLWLGPKEINVEQALTFKEIETGMMFRKEMGEMEGMLFVFSEPMRASFWMRNTLLPLTCAYINASGEILEIHDMKPLDEAPIVAKTEDIQYVLEMKQGWFERNNVAIGAVVRTEKGTLSETYFGRH